MAIPGLVSGLGTGLFFVPLSMLAFQDAFLLTGLAAFAMIPMAFLMRKPDQNRGGTGVSH